MIPSHRLTLATVFGSILSGVLQAQTVLHVDSQATGPLHDGTTWCSAYTDLSQALAVASAGATVKVAAGLYIPDSTGLTNPREATFRLVSGVSIEGGYAGCMAGDSNARDFELFETILSGDLKGNDDPVNPGGPGGTCCEIDFNRVGCDDATCETTVCAERPSCCDMRWDTSCLTLANSLCCGLCLADDTRCDNSYHVLSADAGELSTVIDGVIVADGHANGNSTAPGDSEGGGVRAINVPMVVRHTRFEANWARQGGGLYSVGNISLVECTLHSNQSQVGGGAFVSGNGEIRQCSFLKNVAQAALPVNHTGFGEGGGLYLGGSFVVSDSMFEQNTSLSEGGGVKVIGNGLLFERCIFARNRSPGGGAARISVPSDVTFSNCLIIGDAPEGQGGMMINHGEVSFLGCTFIGPAGLRFARSASATIVNSVFWNPNGGSKTIPTLEPSFRTTIRYSCVQGLSAVFPGPGNFDFDPMFVDPIGPDGVPGTGDENWNLMSESPCINRGDPVVAPDPKVFDLDGQPRVQGCRVDMGAFESFVVQDFGDFHPDGRVDLRDIAFSQLCFGADEGNPAWQESCRCVFDFDGNQLINLNDFAEFQNFLITGP